MPALYIAGGDLSPGSLTLFSEPLGALSRAHMVKSRALKMNTLRPPFHYVERIVTVNTVIYGR